MLSILVCHSYFLRFDAKQVERGKPYPPLATLQCAALLRRAGHQVSLFDAMLAETLGEHERTLHSVQPQVVLLYEDNFNFLSKMCLAKMRSAACQMIAAARGTGARVIAAGSDVNEHITEGRSAGEPRIDVNECGAFLFGLHRPAEGHGVGLRRVRAHEQNTVTVGEVLLVVGGRAAAERGAQTGHRGAVSYPRLVLDRHHSQPTAEQLLDEVVLLIVNRCPAQRADAAHRVEQAALLVARREIGVASRLDALGDLVQRPIQRPRLPMIGVGSTV